MTKRKFSASTDGVSSCISLLNKDECQVVRDWAIRNSQSMPGHTHSSQEASQTPLRRCREYVIDPVAISFEDGSTLESRIIKAFNLGNVWDLEYSDIPSVRVMEYQIGDGYGRHVDWSNGAAKNRKISMTVQLSDPEFYKGGEVTLYPGPESQDISSRQGDATIWPSWTLHEVKPVIHGIRYSLTTWAHGGPFK